MDSSSPISPAEPAVGGDLFDVIAIKDHEVALLMVDVSGHRMPAALLTRVAKVLSRSGVEQCDEPSVMLRWINRQISAYLAAGEFLTVFIGWCVSNQQPSAIGDGG